MSTGHHIDQYLMDKVHSKQNRLFKARDGQPQLELALISRSNTSGGGWDLQLESPVKITNLSELRQIETQENVACTRIYTIRHLRSWATLDISHETFEYLIATHNVFNHFWRCVLTFGIKFEENEYEFPPFRARNSRNTQNKIDELAYVIRRVEPNNSSTENGACPWSIRQSAVYHKLIYPNNHDRSRSCTSVFILIAPSRATERDISQCLPGYMRCNNATRPDFMIHECLVRDSLKGWGDYQAWLEAESRQISNRVLVVDILKRGSGGPSRNISFSAEDRQRLKQLDYYITDMLVILQTMVDSINRIGKSCRQHCQIRCDAAESCPCIGNISEFEEHAAEAQMYLDRAKCLKERVQSTEQLCLHLSDLLAYEEAAALTQLAQASQIESQEMVKLAAQNARDAAAVKVLTIIGLVYLPTTIVSNFFSTQFVRINDLGKLQISRQVWILAVVSVPLTFLTVFIWWVCDRYSIIETLLGSRENESELESARSRDDRIEEDGRSLSNAISLSTVVRSQSPGRAASLNRG